MERFVLLFLALIFGSCAAQGQPEDFQASPSNDVVLRFVISGSKQTTTAAPPAYPAYAPAYPSGYAPSYSTYPAQQSGAGAIPVYYVPAAYNLPAQPARRPASTFTTPLPYLDYVPPEDHNQEPATDQRRGQQDPRIVQVFNFLPYQPPQDAQKPPQQPQASQPQANYVYAQRSQPSQADLNRLGNYMPAVVSPQYVYTSANRPTYIQPQRVYYYSAAQPRYVATRYVPVRSVMAY